MPKQIYAIYDNVAHSIIGGLHLHPHHAPAIRMFGDVASIPNSQISMHPGDFDLLRLGEIDEEGKIVESTKSVILAGATWAAAQKPQLVEQEA